MPSWRLEHNDLQTALRMCCLLEFIPLYMVLANLLHGPFRDDAIITQVVEPSQLGRQANKKFEEVSTELLAGSVNARVGHYTALFEQETTHIKEARGDVKTVRFIANDPP